MEPVIRYLTNTHPEVMHSVQLRHNYGDYVNKMLSVGKAAEIKDMATYKLVCDICLVVSAG